MQHPNREQLRRLWENALAEDGFENDVTSLLVINEGIAGSAQIVARQAGIFAGAIIFDVLKEAYAQRITVRLQVGDGDALKADTTIATLTGPIRLLLGIERTLLNFLQRLCGVATLTRQYVDAVAGTRAKIYDTRKTVPGWRQLDKYAVGCGGGQNHRMGLHDAILVKDNHLAHIEISELLPVVSEMVNEASRLNPPPGFVEFEVDSVEQLDELLKVSGIDVILLDNFTIDLMRKAVARRDALDLAGKIELEASGNIVLNNVRKIAETGVDRISLGAITHSAPALDIGMEIETGV
ncbi:MAG: carboxylating nicotinate-nucleotide diphosphorylase [Planctomycetota bacterium]|nr:MAG: carboxylating nicotinate-nucleotide diphosphorylase [Planctomycetota bacterium]